MTTAIHAQRLEEAVRESNCIEGEPTEGESFDRHLRAAQEAIFSADKGILVHPLVLHRSAYDGFYDHGGKYRQVDVYINSTVNGLILFPSPEDVPNLMDSWWASLAKAEPWEAHVAFEGIHPFEDGNGRIGRCVLWAMEHMKGQSISVIRCKEKLGYYARLQATREERVPA
ncbi:hypothetical protein LCGC14_1680780 [marine sediment metagenome]|uniref:Fido domain-containing protein n=1 Tax=marine sediment metagenome TaxID=412755 RepID=A0A0F9KNP1_9ZZZZ